MEEKRESSNFIEAEINKDIEITCMKVGGY